MAFWVLIKPENFVMDSSKVMGFFLGLVLVSFPLLLDGQVMRSKADRNPLSFDPTQVTTLSWDPRVFLYTRFLSDEESDHLVGLAKKGELEKSEITDEDGNNLQSEDRTSSGMFLAMAQDQVVARIEARMAAWTYLPIENGEAMQILRYEIGEKYDPHYDYYKGDEAGDGGFRYATVLMYLSHVDKGGETVFPNAQANVSQPKDDSWSDCARTGYAVKPRRGDALLFYSLHLDATTDPNSLHGSCPVIEGEKWSATKWIHVSNYAKPKVVECVDMHPYCAAWANNGECTKNPRDMIGSRLYPGYCRKTCNAC